MSVNKGKDPKRIHRCTECGHAQSKWAGQCPACLGWNTLVESLEDRPGVFGARFEGYAGASSERAAVALSSVAAESIVRIPCGLDEFDRVLGGGLVPGSAILIGGDPGIGKSTLLLQTAAALSQHRSVLYITGEESISQVSLRAKRLGLSGDQILILAETELERILDAVQQHHPDVLVVDSIQTTYSGQLQSAPGSVAQVRESAQQLVRLAKETQTTVFLVGHVTKEGALAGPRVLEHMVDTVLYFEGDSGSRFRVIRAFKNRFGAVNELGVFAMTEIGLKEVKNPSAIFLSRGDEAAPGSSVMVMREGSRPMLVEVQALVDESHQANPRRVAVGMDNNRLAMLLAILHRHGGIPILGHDVFVNLVGGLRLSETAGDLAVALAVVSSFRDKPIPHHWVVFGELGLNGEVRPVQNGEERLREAAKHGFSHALAPFKNLPREGQQGLEVLPVKTLREAIAML
ncbi:MAG: DNA repair protein RadA [Gammaproteobacteria bacterium]|nr:DNA repair protein RadA [Gammaproteobacteria bacterium]NBT43396.1 DNA repair protein RadA [Gammaproteobacteria bacterium]NBY22393.1 DNA repair protein RadA [Gammaproteobacteria bacterium]NDE33232.1 DNA repair protein RadA [Gammaproteobacteria bacterium]NDE55426.1 DNA repair protein RadA [Gammaproteobacteria bacterium]